MRLHDSVPLRSTDGSVKKGRGLGDGALMKTRDSRRGVGGLGHGPRVLLSLMAHDAIVRRDCTGQRPRPR